MQVVVLGANHAEDETRFGSSYHKQKEGRVGPATGGWWLTGIGGEVNESAGREIWRRLGPVDE